MAADLLKTYARAIREKRRAHPDVSEPALAPDFQSLVTQLLPRLTAIPPLVVVPEYQRPGAGRPDIALVPAGQLPAAFVELKALAKAADPTLWSGAHDKRQFDRLKELPCWAACNFSDIQLWRRDGRLDEAAVVPARALSPDVADARADTLIDAHDAAPFLALLTALCRAQPPHAADARELASFLAHSARYVRSAVQERIGELRAQGAADHPLLQVRETFRDVLYAHPEAGGYAAADFDALFAGAFAQTLAFGLLLVREAGGAAVGDDAWQRMPAEHPLMRTALRVLSLPEVADEMRIGFDLLRGTVNGFAPEILAIDSAGRDPILYFYEDFLQVFDPAARERYGVYYTPVEVVRYMVGALDRALREDLGTQGLRDPDVTILDPATGTGTFPLGVAERVRADTLAETKSEAEAQMALRELAGRLYGFELLVGPYAVAHYRLHHALGRPVAGRPAPNLPRLGIYLADTLAQPGGDAPAGPLGFVAAGIQDERRAANRIKAEQPILAILGNPPYRRLEAGENATLVGRWMDELWDDLKAPVRAAGQGGQLNTFPELSVAFWRWAMWKLFEAENAPKRGVVAFITNRKFLTGWPYAGLRKQMRERFDKIAVVDLRGDVRAGTRGNVSADGGVFNIMVGTAITVAIADGTKAAGVLATLQYADVWQQELYDRASKLSWLSDHADVGDVASWLRIEGVATEDWRPRPFQAADWLSLKECFQAHGLGIQSKRDHVVYDLDKISLQTKLKSLLLLADEAFREAASFPDTNAARRAKAAGYDDKAVTQVAYRPLDNRIHYSNPRFNYSLRPWLFDAFRQPNVTIYTLAQGVGAGPAVWVFGLMPDYHAFRGSYGGYAFPLHDRRAGPRATNVSPTLLAHLGDAYGVAVPADDVFDAILALLSATSYTHRFAEDLEDTFPHVPFPAAKAVFDRAAAIGRDIRAIETFARAPRPVAGVARLETALADGDIVQTVQYRDGEIAIGPHGRGRLSGIPAAVWSFAVSGYRVLPRWIEARKGRPATLAFVRELRDVALRIHELIHHFDAADLVLAETLADTLTRTQLGFEAASGDG